MTVEYISGIVWSLALLVNFYYEWDIFIVFILHALSEMTK